jgi:AcrR family transcriptional regulator
VLHAAIAVADEVGLESLTMRRLGAHLGVEAMSLYKHVASKEELLDGMVDMVVSQIDLPSAAADWKTAMRERAYSARQVLASHPWAIGMMESRTEMGPAALRYVDAVIGSLRAGGFPVAMAAHAFVVLDSFIYGFVVQEIGMALDNSDEAAEKTGALEALANEYPHLAAVAAEHAAGPGHTYEDEFDFGLKLILDALETHASVDKPVGRPGRKSKGR